MSLRGLAHAVAAKGLKMTATDFFFLTISK
jgi:hypothetical protein